MGNVVEKYTYDPYGQPTIRNGAGSILTASAITNPHLFTGRRLDPETNLFYFRNRMYSSVMGRFLQRDPIGYYDSMNLFQYVRNNSLRWRDPFGLKIYEHESPIGTIVIETNDQDGGLIGFSAPLNGHRPSRITGFGIPGGLRIPGRTRIGIGRKPSGGYTIQATHPITVGSLGPSISRIDLTSDGKFQDSNLGYPFLDQWINDLLPFDEILGDALGEYEELFEMIPGLFDLLEDMIGALDQMGLICPI
jgi:RHS repeat-associated protein